jgi:PAS domain S-box-containing protein
MADEIVSSVADDLPVGVWVARAPNGEFLYANKAFGEIMGMGARDDVGRGEYAGPYGIHARTGELYPEEKMPFVRALHERRTVVVDDIVIHRHDGGRVHIRAQARPIFDTAGQITHVVIAFIDISREAQAEEARALSEQRLGQMQRMDSVGTLAGGIAHDFNNLLAAVKMMAAVLRRNENDTTKLAYLEQIDQVTDSAAQLTRALLGFARRGKHLASRVSVHDVALGVASLMRRALDRRIEVVTDLRASTGDVDGDFSQVEQVLMNLVVNARDAMSNLENGGKLVIATRDEGGNVILEVTDSGSGIDANVRDRMFEPYVTTKKGGEGGGTGLGLATVWGIVENHGGRIEALDAADCAGPHRGSADAKPRGTTMRVTFPAAKDESVRAPWGEISRDVIRGSGTVLVVDDERPVRDSVAAALRGLGYRVLSAEDGEKAVELVRERPDIDVVLLDMVMPHMDGRATYLALRDMRPELRVVLTTGFALNEEAQRILDLGVREFIAKPFSVESLSQVLARSARPSDAPPSEA